MTERDVIVRCPGCGNGKVISLAVGQLLQCDICRTTFQAPIDMPDAGAAAAGTDAFIVGLPPAPAASTGSPERTPMSGAPTDPSRDAAARDPHITRTRSWRTEDFDVATPPAPAPRRDVPAIAPRCPAADSAEPTADARDDREGEELLLVEPRGRIWAVISILAGSIIVATLVLGGVLLFRGLAGVGPSDADVSTPTIQSSAVNSLNAHWTDASQASQRRDSVTLKVVRATYGTVRARDLRQQVITTEDDNLLAITVSVRNLGPRARGFQNWYGHAFEAGDGAEVIAELFDDQQRSYSLLKFDDVTRIEGQRLADQIDPKETVQDTVVFLIPKEIDRAAIRSFRLTLPGAAVGMNDFFRFQIPTSMIEGFHD